MWHLGLIFLALSAIIKGDTTELAALHQNNNEAFKSMKPKISKEILLILLQIK